MIENALELEVTAPIFLWSNLKEHTGYQYIHA